jgi:hypothetical protein
MTLAEKAERAERIWRRAKERRGQASIVTETARRRYVSARNIMRFERAPDFFPTARVAPVLAAWIERYEAETQRDTLGGWARPAEGAPTCPVGARDWLAAETKRIDPKGEGVSLRGLWRYMNGERLLANRRREIVPASRAIPLAKVDLLFCAMRCVHLFHLPPEAGGFSDLYFADLDSGDLDSDVEAIPVAA